QLAAQWRERREELVQVLRYSPALSRAKACPYHDDQLLPALKLIDVWLREPAGMPPPSCFEILGTQKMQQHRLKKADPALSDPFFAACQDLQDQLVALRHELSIACLRESTRFAR